MTFFACEAVRSGRQFESQALRSSPARVLSVGGIKSFKFITIEQI